MSKTRLGVETVTNGYYTIRYIVSIVDAKSKSPSVSGFTLFGFSLLTKALLWCGRMVQWLLLQHYSFI